MSVSCSGFRLDLTDMQKPDLLGTCRLLVCLCRRKSDKHNPDVSVRTVENVTRHLHKLTLYLTLCLAACVTRPAGDADPAQRLFGKWSESNYIGSGTREQSIDFRPDGTFAIAGVLRNVQGVLKFSASGTWIVQGGYLIFNISKSDGPGDFTRRRARIVSISDWELVMTDSDTGEEQRAWRYPK